MRIDLDREDLVSLVKGTQPSYSAMTNPTVQNNGTFSGSQLEWKWNIKLDPKLSDLDLWNMYVFCKDSWK